jgi:hypothetical protein
MRQLLFNLQQVPEDEAEEVRLLLRENNIAFYETQAGRWRIGLAALWLPDGSQKAKAEKLLEDYQQQRYQNAGEQRALLQEKGFVIAFIENLYAQPVKVIAAIAGIALVLGFSVLPFIL